MNFYSTQSNNIQAMLSFNHAIPSWLRKIYNYQNYLSVTKVHANLSLKQTYKTLTVVLSVREYFEMSLQLCA